MHLIGWVLKFVEFVVNALSGPSYWFDIAVARCLRIKLTMAFQSVAGMSFFVSDEWFELLQQLGVSGAPETHGCEVNQGNIGG
jgi:hypothetical protein